MNRIYHEPDFLLSAVGLRRGQRALDSSGGKVFLGPLGDQMPFDLGEQPQQGYHHLRQRALLPRQAERLLDGDEANLPLRRSIDDLNDFPRLLHWALSAWIFVWTSEELPEFTVAVSNRAGALGGLLCRGRRMLHTSPVTSHRRD